MKEIEESSYSKLKYWNNWHEIMSKQEAPPEGIK